MEWYTRKISEESTTTAHSAKKQFLCRRARREASNDADSDQKEAARVRAAARPLSPAAPLLNECALLPLWTARRLASLGPLCASLPSRPPSSAQAQTCLHWSAHTPLRRIRVSLACRAVLCRSTGVHHSSVKKPSRGTPRVGRADTALGTGVSRHNLSRIRWGVTTRSGSRSTIAASIHKTRPQDPLSARRAPVSGASTTGRHSQLSSFTSCLQRRCTQSRAAARS